jgi:hypothetical protein
MFARTPHWHLVLAALFTMLFALSAPAVSAAPPLPVIPAGTFAATSYGAVGDGVTDNTAAIQAALNAAKAAGGGTVEIAAATQPYLCGPITVYGGTNLQVDTGATLQALRFGTYPNSSTSPAHFITIASGSTNVQLSGGGTIDGNGSDWWTAYNNKAISNRPRLIQINHADTFRITGLTLQNAPMFHVAFNATNNVTIDGVTITAPATSPNTDAIDPAGQHYLITACTISVGDDNIAVKAGSTFCGDIAVTNCAFGTGHGVSIGGQTNAGVDGFTVDRCTFNGTTTGLRLKADATQGGPVRNIVYSNLTMTDVQYPFVFYSYYADVGSPGALSGSNQTTPAKVAAWNASPPDALDSNTIPTWQNITLRNVTATGARGYSVIWGLPLASALIQHVTLDHVQISGAAGLEIYNANDVQFVGGTAFSVPAQMSAVTTYNALAITAQPEGVSVAPNGTAVFSVGVTGTSGIAATASSYQWLHDGAIVTNGTLPDGTTVTGADSATLMVSHVHAADAGAYSVLVSNALDTYADGKLAASNAPVTAPSAAAQLAVGTFAGSRLANLSVRSVANTGDQTLIVGFVVSGYGKPVLVRAVGPTLVNYGVAASSVLKDPQLFLYDATGIYGSNDNWGSTAAAPLLASTASAVSAFALIEDSLDAAMVKTLNDGIYSAHVTANGPSGVVLAEIYDADLTTSARLVNLSARGLAGAGDKTLIAGFSIVGSAPKTLLIRGIGPTLGAFGVGRTLADPQVAVYRQQDAAYLGGNNDWGSVTSSPEIAAAVSATGAFPLTDGSRDAALLITLDPGLYSAQVTGPNGTTGVAMVEVYEVK